MPTDPFIQTIIIVGALAFWLGRGRLSKGSIRLFRLILKIILIPITIALRIIGLRWKP